GGDRSPDRSRGIRMHGHIGAPVFGRLDRSTKLRFGELDRLDRIVGRTDATAAHQLDLTGPLSQLLARAQPYLIGAVGNGCYARELGLAQRPSPFPRNLVAKPKVSMARG